MTIPQAYKQYGQIPFFYINGLGISNDATTPNTKLDIATGTMIDSTQTFQIDLLTAAVIDATTTGLNGLDTGTLGASKVYAVYLVGDPVTSNLSGCMISLNQTTPLLPFGYSVFGKIGYVTTDASSHFLLGYWTAGIGSARTFFYDAPQATAITAGHGTTYTNVNLITLVPASVERPVWISTSYVPATAGNTLKMQPGNATGDAITITGQVAAIAVTSNSLLMAQTVVISTVASPVINYKEANASDAVAINVAGYQFDL